MEVRARSRPPATPAAMADPERAAFAQAGVDPDVFRGFLRERGLALLVMRNVTTRESRDRQQPFNLRVPGGEATVRNGGVPRDVTHMQFVQADAIRGIGGRSSPMPRPAPARAVPARPRAARGKPRRIRGQRGGAGR